jgi:Protein of unknown function (DUF3224)
MATHALSALVISNWEESALQPPEGGAALAQATADAVFTGALDGNGKSTLLLVYPPEGVASFAGTQVFSGTLDGRSGTFVLQLTGTFENNTASVTWSVMPDSATGELRGLRGEGGYKSAADAPAAEATLDYELS